MTNEINIEEITELCCASIQAAGFSAKVVDGSRILVSRKLSKGWQQMGYVDVDSEGVANTKPITRQTATIREACARITESV